MQPCRRPDYLWVTGLLLLALWMPGKVSVWLDPEGRPVLSNRDAPDGSDEIRAEDVAARWRGQWEGEPLRTPEPDPLGQQLAAAQDDLRRGEQGRALVTLRRLVREFPARPEAHWALARVERARGRHTAALESIELALSVAAEMPEGWRARAEAARQQILAELAHADTLSEDGSAPFVQHSAHFALHYDHPFAARGYGDRVLRALEHIRGAQERELGRALPRPLEVRLYTRADYLRGYGHRFGFGTVGFYDGAIHVVAARHPERRLAALLSHEYVHALFHDALGGHRPFFLNEGLAERAEERAAGRSELARGEWRKLVTALREQRWIPLRELVDAFNRLESGRVPLAYLESRAVVDLLDRQDPGALARWLARCGRGEPWETALRTETGQTLDELDQALRRDVLSRFPPSPESIAIGAP